MLIEISTDIIAYLRDEFKLLVGEPTAEVVKLNIASAIETDYQEREVRGRDMITGLPRALMITDGDMREALLPPLTFIVSGIKEVLETAPPEMMSDIIVSGIMLSGGGALLPGIASLLKKELQIPIHIAEDPLSAVARGTGIILENFEEYKGVLLPFDDYVVL